jgi:Ca2+-binding RTX toxin-like protein
MYDVDSSNLGSALSGVNPTVFTQDTINQILNLVASTTGSSAATFEKVAGTANAPVTVTAGTEILQVSLAANTTTKLDMPSNLPVMIFEGATAGVEVTLKDTASTTPTTSDIAERVVITGGGNNKITVEDAKNTKIVASAGNDTITGGSGSDTVVAGGGNDTISGGSGFDVVQVKGDSTNVQVNVNADGSFTLTGATGETIQLQGVQYVALDNGDAIIAAQDTVEAAVATLYKSILGRTAEADGLKDWFNLAHNGWTLDQIAQGFVDSSEGHAHMQGTSNDDFLNQLYQNNFGRAADAEGFAFWKKALETGASRGDVASAFAEVSAQNLAGTVHTETTTVGVIKVVAGNI